MYLFNVEIATDLDELVYIEVEADNADDALVLAEEKYLDGEYGFHGSVIVYSEIKGCWEL